MSTLGDLLRQQRTSRNISLKAAEEAIRINRKVLEAIEDDQHGELGLSPVYVRGFVRAYCRYLEIDEKKALALYDQDLRSAEIQLEKGRRSPKRHIRRVLRMVLILVVLIVLVLGVFYATGRKLSRSGYWPLGPRLATEEPGSAEKKTEPALLSDGPQTGEPDSPLPPAPGAPGEKLSPEGQEMAAEEIPLPEETMRALQTTAEPTVAEAPKVLEEQKEPPQPPSVSVPLTLVVEGKARTWMEVSIDEGQSFQIMLFAGDAITWKATKTISLRIGNAGGVILNLNGTDLKLFGRLNEVVNLVLTDTSVSINQGSPQSLDLWRAAQPE